MAFEGLWAVFSDEIKAERHFTFVALVIISLPYFGVVW